MTRPLNPQAELLFAGGAVQRNPLPEPASDSPKSESEIFRPWMLLSPGVWPLSAPSPTADWGRGSAYALPSVAAHRQDTVISILVAGTLRSEAPLRDMAGRVPGAAGGCETGAAGARGGSSGGSGPCAAATAVAAAAAAAALPPALLARLQPIAP